MQNFNRQLLLRDELHGTTSKKTFKCDVDSGCGTWDLLNAKLKGTRGLPVAQPKLDDKQRKKSQPQEPLDAATLLRQLREHGFVLELLLPACLHPSQTVLPDMQILEICDEQGWSRFLSHWPATSEAATIALLNSCFRKIRGKAFHTRMLGYHGVWEAAVLCVERGVSQVFSERQLKMLVSALLCTFKGNMDEAIGRPAAGSYVAAALWWLLTQPKLMMKQPLNEDGEDIEEEDGEARQPAREQASATRGGDGSSTSLKAAGQQEREDAGRDAAQHRWKALRRVTKHLANPSSQQVLQGLLRCGLMRSCTGALMDICRQARDPQRAHQLQHGFRSGHKVLAAAWTVGVLRQALSSRFVRNALGHQSLADLAGRREQGAARKPGKILEFQEAVNVVALAPAELWDCLLSASALPAYMCFGLQRKGSLAAGPKGGAAARADAEAAPADAVVEDNDVAAAGPGSQRAAQETSSVPPARHELAVNGREKKAVLLLPMSWEEALVRIQSGYRVHLASARWRELRARIKAAMHTNKGARAMKFATQEGPLLTEDDKKAAEKAGQLLKALRPAEPDIYTALKTYFHYPAMYCPSVAAAETLAVTLQASPQLLDHFLETADLAQLLALLKTALPLRVQHLACVLISALLRGGISLDPDASNLVLQQQRQNQAGNPSSSKGMNTDVLTLQNIQYRRVRLASRAEGNNSMASSDKGVVHILVPQLAQLLSLEASELEARHGPAPLPPPRPGPRSYPYPSLPPLDPLWASQGSLISVHAAVCVWGCCKVLVAEAKEEEAKRARLAAANRKGGAASFEDQVALLMQSSSELSLVEKTMREVLTMAAAAVTTSPKCGPATHVLCTALVALALEPASLELLVKHGLIDRGDQMVLDSSARARGYRHNKSLLKQPGSMLKQSGSMLPGGAEPQVRTLGVTSCCKGVIGLMVDTSRPDHAECAAATIALVAMGEAGMGRAGKAAARGSLSSPSPLQGRAANPGPRPHMSQQQQQQQQQAGMGSGGSGGRDAWPRRMLLAGGWCSLARCLASLPSSEELRLVVAIGIMYLSQEVARTYEVLLQRAEERRSRPLSRNASLLLEADMAAPNPGFESQHLMPDPRLSIGVSDHCEPMAQRCGAPDAVSSEQPVPDFPERPDLSEIYFMLAQDLFDDMPAAVEIVVKLLHSKVQDVMLFAALTAYHLAAVPELKEHLGVAGAVAALVECVRRWVDAVSSEQRQQKQAMEWVMAALTRLMQGAEGSGNVKRFAEAWKPVSKEEAAREEMRGFGYPMHPTPGAAPTRPGRTAHELVCSTLWSGYGWGQGQVDSGAYADSLGKWDSVSFQRMARRSASNELVDEMHNNSKQDSRSAVDPISLMVQVVDIRTRQKSAYLHIKLPALLVLKYMSRLAVYRARMVEAGAGEQLAAVSIDPGYDSRTRAAAAALWLAVGESAEGQDPRWWSCMVGKAEVASASGNPGALQRLHLRAQALLQVKMLTSREVEQEVVGAKGAGGLLCKGDIAKAIFLEVGGLAALLQVAGAQGKVMLALAPTCTALLNLSSYIPIQVEMCQRALQLLLHLNSKHAGLNGYAAAQALHPRHESESEYTLPAFQAGSPDISPHPGGGTSRSQPMSPEPRARSLAGPQGHQQLAQSKSALVLELLYATSGSLWNLSRNPDNRTMMYDIELRTKTRRAAADVLVAGSRSLAAEAVSSASASTAVREAAAAASAVTSSQATALAPVMLPQMVLTPGQADILTALLSQPMCTAAPRHDTSSAAGLTQASVQASRMLINIDLPSRAESTYSNNQPVPEGQGQAFLPSLPSLAQNLRRPLASIWAPLLVDSHNSPAAPLFALREQQEEQGQAWHSTAGGYVQEPLASSVVPSRPAGASISSRWSPLIADVHELTPNLHATAAAACYDDQESASLVEDVRWLFDEGKQCPVRVQNFRPLTASGGRQQWRQGIAPQAGPRDRSSQQQLASSPRSIDVSSPIRQPKGQLLRCQAGPTHGNRVATAGGLMSGSSGISATRSGQDSLGLLRSRSPAGNVGAQNSIPACSMLSQLQGIMKNMDGRDKAGSPLPLGSSQPGSTFWQAGRDVQGTDAAGQRRPVSPLQRGHQQFMAQSAAEARVAAVVDYETPRVAMWAEVPGAKVYEGLFPAYNLPSGTGAYLYRHRKTRVDEVRPPGEQEEDDDLHGDRPGNGDIDDLARGILERMGDLPFEPVPPQLMTDQGIPSPATSTIPSLEDLSKLSACAVPHTPEPALPDAPVAAAGRQWRLEDSIFAPKPRENDSRGFYDYDGIVRDAFEADWARCNEKARFGKMLAKLAPGETLTALKSYLKSCYLEILEVFDFYSSLGSGDAFAMHIVPWGELMLECSIAVESSVNCKLSDLDRVFLATNFEEEKGSEASKNNLDNALMRFEFLEALVRVASVKFLEKRETKRGGKKGKKVVAAEAQKETGEHAPSNEQDLLQKQIEALGPCPDIINACQRLLGVFIMPGVVPESKIEANFFRRTRLYLEDVDILLKERKRLLKAIFDHYRQLANASDDNFLDLPEWLELMTEGGLFHRYFTVREAKLAFIWSRMRCQDESSSAKAYQRSRSLTFLEFLEALGRVADMVSPPPPQELIESGCLSDQPTAEYYKRALEQGCYFADRPSAAHVAPKTRPLDEKMDQVLEVLLVNLMECHAARDEEQLLVRLSQRRGRGYQLGKSGM